MHRFRFSCRAALAGAVLCASLPAMAATLTPALTPERVYSDPDINGPTARSVQLAPDGTLVTWLSGKKSDQNTLDLWAADTKGGAPFVLVDSAKLESGAENLSEAEKSRRERMRTGALHGVVEYHWDEQGRFLLVPVNGDLYLAERAGGTVRRLTDTPADEVDSKVSPKGHYVSFVRDGNMFVIDLATGKETALTTDGKDPVSWGTSEFAAQEEMDRFTGNWWAPDERHIALTHVDESGVDIIPRLEVGAQGIAARAAALSPRRPSQCDGDAVCGRHRRAQAGEDGPGRRSGFLPGPRQLVPGQQNPLRPAPVARPEAAGPPGLRSRHRRLPRDRQPDRRALG